MEGKRLLFLERGIDLISSIEWMKADGFSVRSLAEASSTNGPSNGGKHQVIEIEIDVTNHPSDQQTNYPTDHQTDQPRASHSRAHATKSYLWDSFLTITIFLFCFFLVIATILIQIYF